jgi:paired amphipathic helix protein Sin3a
MAKRKQAPTAIAANPPQKQKGSHQPDFEAERQKAMGTLLVPPPALPMHPASAPISSTMEELQWFERVRKHINNKTNYTEFLRMLNAYTQDIVTSHWLLQRAHEFIGNSPELYSWFKKYMKFTDVDEHMLTIAVENNISPPESARVSLANCRSLGPSYRMLPKQVCIHLRS